MPQDRDRILQILRKSHLFVGLDDTALGTIADRFKFTYYKPDELICRKGEEADRFYVVYRGKVEVWVEERGGRRSLGTLIPGDYFGEEGLIQLSHRRAANVSAVHNPTVVAYLDERNFKEIVAEFPDVYANLKMIVRSRQLARAARFDWLGKDESIYLVARKHAAFLWLRMGATAAFLVLAGLLAWGGRASGLDFLYWLGVLALIGAVGLGIWHYVDWGNDYYIVTNQRVIWLEKIVGLYESRQEAPLHVVHSVNINTTQIGRLLGYGDVGVHTFTSSITMKEVPDPHRIAALVNEHWKRAQERQKLAQEISMRRTVRETLNLDPNAASLPPGIPWPPQPLPPPQTTLSFWDKINVFKMRYEEGDKITFRKHWLVLMYKTWLPFCLILLNITVMVVGWFNLIAGAFTLLGLMGWWLYQYVDWRNDIYQVTSEKLYDIDRKPLGSEQRKEAPLENVLSIKVDRHGLLRVLFNFGNVIVDVSGSKFTFDNIYNPAQAQQDIFWRMDALKRKKQTQQELQEYKRIARWLKIYHQETHNPPPPGETGEFPAD
ncbi:MAG: hypothetical protein D6755_10990 [Anaerolineae bacterium]|nr:MAG: hypothetical protein D6755_10990 [Anaerolineae bacterium]